MRRARTPGQVAPAAPRSASRCATAATTGSSRASRFGSTRRAWTTAWARARRSTRQERLLRRRLRARRDRDRDAPARRGGQERLPRRRLLHRPRRRPALPEDDLPARDRRGGQQPRRVFFHDHHFERGFEQRIAFLPNSLTIARASSSRRLARRAADDQPREVPVRRGRRREDPDPAGLAASATASSAATRSRRSCASSPARAPAPSAASRCRPAARAQPAAQEASASPPRQDRQADEGLRRRVLALPHSLWPSDSRSGPFHGDLYQPDYQLHFYRNGNPKKPIASSQLDLRSVVSIQTAKTQRPLGHLPDHAQGQAHALTVPRDGHRPHPAARATTAATS
jgi:hypothetical protein